jgi:hypothetical protein
MGKARRLITLALRKRPFLPILATSVAIIGSIAAVLGIIDVHFGVLGTTVNSTTRSIPLSPQSNSLGS